MKARGRDICTVPLSMGLSRTEGDRAMKRRRFTSRLRLAASFSACTGVFGSTLWLAGPGIEVSNLPQKIGLWTAYCARLITVTLVEEVAALIEGVNLHGSAALSSEGTCKSAAPVSGISPPCSCSSVYSLPEIRECSDLKHGRSTLDCACLRMAWRIGLEAFLRAHLLIVS